MIVKHVILVLALSALACVSTSAQPQRCTKAIDPVCGLCVDKDPKLSATYKGETYYFCLTRDLDRFKANPAEFVKR
jgi:YHS domain-containing protein